MAIRLPIELPDDSTIQLNSLVISQGNDIRSSTYTFQTDNTEGSDDLDYVLSTQESDAGFMTSARVRSGGGGYDLIEVTYEDIVSDEYPVYRYALKSGTISRDLNYHDDYKTWWNHHVIKRRDSTQTGFNADLWKAITDDTPGQSLSDYAWSVQTAAVSPLYEIVLKAKKPGVNAYLIPTDEIVETVLTRTEEEAIQAKRNPGTTGAPDNTLGVDATENKWLCFSATIARQGPWWLTTNVYRFAQRWDEDLYG